MKTYTFSSLICVLLISACSPVYYVPNAQNVPMISEKHDLTVMVSPYSVTEDLTEEQFNLQAAYGLTDETAIMANYYNYAFGKNERGTANFVEIGAGYFNSEIKYLNFEIYGLLGRGNMSNNLNYDRSPNTYTYGTLEADFVRFGFQPVAAFKTKYFTAAFSSRFMRLNYSNIEGNLVFREVDQIDYLQRNRNQFLIEPAITLKAGFKDFKLQVQYVASTNLGNPDFLQESEVVSIGLVVNTNVKKRNK